MSTYDYREQQMLGFVIGDEDIEHYGIDPNDVPNELFDEIVISATDYLQDSFQSAMHNALVEAGLLDG